MPSLIELPPDVLLTRDTQGRLTTTRDPTPRPAPRLFLGRSGDGDVWALRRDLDAATSGQPAAVCHAPRGRTAFAAEVRGSGPVAHGKRPPMILQPIGGSRLGGVVAKDRSAFQRAPTPRPDAERHAAYPADADPAALLQRFPVSELRHLGRPMLDHLVGCHDLLVRWGASPDLSRAGAFHSIYGTATFREAAVARSERTRVRIVIGAEAERLAFLFSCGDRRRLLLELDAPPYVWTDHASNASVELDGETFRCLVVLEAANFVEQLPFLDAVSDEVIADMQRRFAVQERWLTPAIREALDEAVARRRSGQDAVP